MLGIISGNLPTSSIVSIQVAQLHGEHSSLYLIHAAVAAFIGEDILARRTVIAQSTAEISQRSIVCGNSPCVAQGSKILARIEAMSSSIPKRASPSSIEHTTMSLRIILDEYQMTTMTEVGNLLRHGTTTIEMHQQYGTRAVTKMSLKLTVIKFKRINSWFHEYRFQSVFSDGKDRSYIGIGRHDDFITILQPT